MNCTKVADTDSTIALRSNWSCLSQGVWSGLGEGDVASASFVIVQGHNFDLSTKPSKSYPNRRDVNWSHQAGLFVAVSFSVA